MTSPEPRVAYLTLAHRRHDHLSAQLRALAHGTARPSVVVIAAMDDDEIAGVAERALLGDDGRPTVELEIIPVPRVGGRLPLAAARNAAARVAVSRGADLLVFLDVDCIPSPALVARYAAAWAERGSASERPVVLSGAVHYLPPRRPGQVDYAPNDLTTSHPHPARPVAPSGETVPADDILLFWSLSFAMGARHWDQVGGFDEGYRGYGGEDTDFALRVQRARGHAYWVGGAPAYHQHHPVDDPPRQHVADIVRNSNRFHERWGFFPMSGWLEAFEAEGLVTRSGRPPRLTLTSSARTDARSG